MEEKYRKTEGERKQYIHCLPEANASDYPWIRTLPICDLNPASCLKFESKRNTKICGTFNEDGNTNMHKQMMDKLIFKIIFIKMDLWRITEENKNWLIIDFASSI